MVWNMVYDPDAPADETIGEVREDEMWARLSDFLHAVVPVAEEAGVRLAIHPDDPPMTRLRGTARIATHPDRLQRILEIVPSRSNALEFCQGTVAEMPDVDVYETIERFASVGAIAYVHFRNVRGHVPDYTEVFIDEGDVDMIEALRRYVRCGFDGVIIPDHTPQMSCAAPWHAGMAYALGFIRAALRVIEAGG
jgi:mannonate dehydratase